MDAESSPKIVTIDESPIGAVILEEGFRDAGFTRRGPYQRNAEFAGAYLCARSGRHSDRFGEPQPRHSGPDVPGQRRGALRSTAMREKRKIGEIAQSILTASELIK
jgi:hypothetical protein